MIAISGVEITDLAGRVLERLVANSPSDVADGSARRTGQLHARRFEKWHRKQAGQFHALFAESDVGGEGFDEILAPVAVVQGAGAEEERYRRINRRFFSSIPDDAQARPTKGNRLIARDRESQFSYGGRGIGECEQDRGFLWANASKRPHGFRGVRRGNVGAGAANQFQDILVRRRAAVPGADGLRQLRASHVLMIDVITGAVAGARIGHAERALERDRHTLVAAQRLLQRHKRPVEIALRSEEQAPRASGGRARPAPTESSRTLLKRRQKGVCLVEPAQRDERLHVVAHEPKEARLADSHPLRDRARPAERPVRLERVTA